MDTKEPPSGTTRYLLATAPGLLLLLLLLTGFTQSEPPAAPTTGQTLAQFEANLEALRQEMLIPGMSAAVVQDQELLWAKGFGYADQERQIVATADTPYHLASVTKPIAATLLMQLLEEGVLDLDDPLAQFGVSVDSLGEPNVWHLLTHTSQGVPGLVHEYSGDRYALLDQVMAGAAGKPFGQLLNERFLTPLAMSHTAPNPTWGWNGYWASLGLGRDSDHYPDVYRELAAPYQLDAAHDNVPGSYSLHFSPAAGLLSNVTDLAKFDIALDQDQLLKPETKAQMFAPAISTAGKALIYGLGWYSQEYKDTRLIWHSGGWPPSVSALLLKAPDLDLTFIILANNYSLTGPYPMGEGDVLYSAPAMLFYKHFIFPRQFGKSVPAVDWQSDPERLLAQLAAITDGDVRDALERELWAYRKLFAATGRMDLAEQLVQVGVKAFPRSGLYYHPPTRWVNNTLPELRPVQATPADMLGLGRLLLAWLILTAGGLLFLAVDFGRASALPRPIKGTWLLNSLCFGLLAVLAYWLSDRRPAGVAGTMSGWRRALGPAMISLVGPLLSVGLGLYLLTIRSPGASLGPDSLLLLSLAAFLLNWLLIQAALRAWAREERYGTALRRSALLTLAATFLAMAGLLLTAQLMAEWWFRSIPVASPYFMIFTISGSLIGAVLVYPLQLWLSYRGLSNWPARSSGRPRPRAAGSPEATPLLES